MSMIMAKVARRAALAAALLLVAGGSVLAAESPRAVTKSPARDGAYLAKMPGLANNVPGQTLAGEKRVLNDGVVIRSSSVEGGKIIIPPSGLFITIRSQNWMPFNNEPILMAGAPYRFITDTYEQSVVRNVTLRRNGIAFSDKDKTRGWQLTSIDTKTYGMTGASTAVFKILKTTGNYYGDQFLVQAGEKVTNAAADGSLAKGSKLPDGIRVPTLENKAAQHIAGSNVATVGRSYVVVDSISANEVKVRELVTDNNTGVWISPKDPVIGAYGKGSKIKAGAATLEVTEVTADSATVKLGNVTKKLGPVNADSMKWMLMDMASREQFMIKSADNKILAHLDLNKPFADGKANLVVYSDVVKVKSGDAWGPDTRFLARPET